MNFIKKCVDKKFDEAVHLQFQKFSKGEFRDRAMIQVKKTGDKFTINTSAEFANEFVRICAQKLGSEKTQITGAVVSTSDLKGKIEFKEIKQFQGVKRYLIDDEMSGEQIIKLLNEFPKTFFALTFEAKDCNLKIKPKAPKSGKPGSSKEDEEFKKPDFCKLITNDGAIGKSFVFEKLDFKKAEISHTFFVEQIVIPEELKKEKDFAIIREKSRRKGKIVREAKIDDQPIKTEIPFEA